MNSKYHELVKLEAELIKLDNDMDSLVDVPSLWRNLWDMKDKTYDTAVVLTNPYGVAALHDSYVYHFSERRTNVFTTKFDVKAYIYIERQEIGYIPMSFEIKSHNSFREISNREIYGFDVSTVDRKIAIRYWRKQRGEWPLGVLFDYESLIVNQGFLVLRKTYQELK